MKKRLLIGIGYICLLLNVSTVQAAGTAMPDINAAAFIVSDEQSGRILAGHAAKATIEPAALTQLMTAYVVLQAIEQHKLTLQQPLTVSEEGWRVAGSRMFMQPKQAVATQTVLQAMLTIAANDAALTLAKAVAGSETAFVRQMNQQASRLGLHNSHFVNCTGLPVAGQYSSAQDILRLVQALWQDFPQYRSWFGQTKFSYHGLTQLNHNLLLFRDSAVTGWATASSINGGYHLVALSQKDQRPLMVVVLGADSSTARAIEAGKLLAWAQNTFHTLSPAPVNQPLTRIPVYRGQQKTVAVGLMQPAYITVPNNGRTTLKPQLEIVQPALAPVRKGEILGKLVWYQGATVVAQNNVVALENVAKGGWLQWLKW